MYPYYHDLYRENPMKSYVRILHASPKSPAVDVYLNNKLAARNLGYKGFTEYLPVPTGTYNVKIFPAGMKTNAVLDTTVNIPAGKILTVAAIGEKPENLQLFPIEDPIRDKVQNKAYIRFAHLSPNAPKVDITLPDGTPLFRNVGYKEVKDYIEVPGGKYTVEARVAGTDNTVLYVPNINLKPGRFYTVYAVGLVGETPKLQVLIPLDGNSYIDFD